MDKRIKYHLYCTEEFVNSIILMFCTHDTGKHVSAGKQRFHFSDIWFWVTGFSSFLFLLEKKEGEVFWSQHLRGKK